MAARTIKLGGKVIGQLEGDVLTKTGRQVVLFRNFDGYGIAEEIIKRHGEFGIKYIRLKKGGSGGRAKGPGEGPSLAKTNNFRGFEQWLGDSQTNSDNNRNPDLDIYVGVEDYLQHGIPYHRDGYEPQLILPQHFWVNTKGRKPNV